MKIIGFVASLNGIKAKCDLCGRKHGRSFVVKHDDGTQKHYGSGCIQKIGINKIELARALSLITVQTARLSYELLRVKKCETL